MNEKQIKQDLINELIADIDKIFTEMCEYANPTEVLHAILELIDKKKEELK